uniref:DUF512 domain-containing protein n=1 Tax=candidate division WOR-3 bacterium TaxID=2052148 RepID=A0A7C6AF34_UNCW3
MVRVVNSNHPEIPKDAQLLMIDKNPINDIFDYHFYNDPTKRRKFLFTINKKKKVIPLNRGEDIQLILEEPQYKKCENDCDYCFVKGLPEGLRKELYFRDDDYRLSFLFGNFLSLTNLTDDDIARIKKLRFSPLYVSVHTTNLSLRSRLFKNKNARLVIDQLKKLIEGDIKIHCQVVVIPKITDGINIEKTVNDLFRLYPGVSSVGIVPVGRTRFLKKLPGINKRLAQQIVRDTNLMHINFRKKLKRGFVYIADEFFIRAGYPIPEKIYYDEFYQYENGIGMIRQLLDEIDSMKYPKNISGKFLFVTGKLAYPYVNYLKNRLADKKFQIDVLPVKNRFFGDTVTVSGLLTGKDIYNALRLMKKNYDRIVFPPNCVNDNGKFLDDFELDGVNYIVAPYSIKELLLWLQ